MGLNDAVRELLAVGCLAGAVLAAPWYIAATRGERYAVTELEVLVWSPWGDETSCAITWRDVLRIKGVGDHLARRRDLTGRGGRRG
ncbi:hypothetical protein Ait01nite_011340 [Actinoplanes italicus]|uniref:Uncharacterized protein n=1 Tax=Actinoplanes italicus TaxID=113567 RepID=A0A2T0KGL0_9ACTN|nr:hypothetical protein [Actinoplanes italicus]PRX22572.1 hypothetical protein CLV67_10499 [Actinoplanes italicus]GIE28089.1 hypothetical protein Ait01nite_011340 [Actinoplanes italicus]